MPDRLPSLIVLAGFWIPPALAGWAAATSAVRGGNRKQPAVAWALLAVVVVAYSVAWYFFNLHRMPPYIPGATMDPSYASPQAAQALAIFTAALILPGSALACALAFIGRRRMLTGAPGTA